MRACAKVSRGHSVQEIALRRRGSLILLILTTAAAIPTGAGCDEHPSAALAPTTRPTSQPSQDAGRSELSTQKSTETRPQYKKPTVAFSIIPEEVGEFDHNRILKVSLGRELDEEEVREVASHIQQVHQGEIVRMDFFLAGEESIVPWGQAIYVNSPEIRITGLTHADVGRILSSESLSSEQNLGRAIGHWVDRGPSGGLISIADAEGALRVRTAPSGGRFRTQGLVRSNADENRFEVEYVRLSSPGDYYRIRDDGRLEIGDREGIVAVIPSVEQVRKARLSNGVIEPVGATTQKAD